MNQKIIVVTGADGSGKSTLVEGLAASGLDAKVASIWDVMDKNLFASKKAIDDYLCQLSPNARLLFLAHALEESKVNAMQSHNEVLVFNGYYYKYFASEMALGASLDLVDELIALFPKPDLVIKLEIEPELAYPRKKKLSRYECGIQEPFSNAFLEFQRLVATHWTHFDTSGWQFINAALPKAEVMSIAMQSVETLAE